MITDQQKVESALANDENCTDEEIVESLIESCPTLTPALIRTVVEAERQVFFLDPFHSIYWQQYLS